MVADPELNVYSGEDGIANYYDPDQCPPIPMVELPKKLNPLRDDGVKIYAKLMSTLPAGNVKSLPALNMLLRAQEEGKVNEDTHTIVEYSSGSTVISLGMIANILNIPNVKAYMSNKQPRSKLELLQFFGVDLTVFGGHRQPSPDDHTGGIYQATEDGKQKGWYNPDQYSNTNNYEAHMRWTGPQILKQLPELSVFAACIGTSGTMTGTGLYLKDKKPSVTRIGVCPAPNQRVPGPRSFSLLEPVEFPWREAVHGIEEVKSFESYEKSLELCRNGLLVGPSSGLALVGLLQFLQRMKDEDKLDSLRNPDGDVICAFICCDGPHQYIPEYTEKLGPEYFHPINNEELLDVDQYPYNVDWELKVEDAHEMLFNPDWRPSHSVSMAPVPGITSQLKVDPTTPYVKEEVIVLDLRDEESFKTSHIPGSLNLPIDFENDLNPFKDTQTLVRQFKALESRMSPDFCKLFAGRKVLTLSHRGHIGRLAMSILRHRSVRAHCINGGCERWKNTELWGRW